MRIPLLMTAAMTLLALTAPPGAALADTVRAAVGKPLQQAELLIQKRDYNAALAKVDQANAVGQLTPYESVVIAQVKGIAAAGAGQYGQAAGAYETVLNSGTVPVAQQTEYIQAIAGFYDQAQDYPQTVIWANRYIAAGGSDPRTRALLAQAYYQQNDFSHAEQAAWRDQRAAAASGQQLPQAELQLLASAAQKSGDSAGYAAALYALLDAYPSPAVFAEAIAQMTASPEFPDRLTIDVYRLRDATGTLTAAADYEDYAERAILAGEPAEANAVIAKGFASGVLTDTTDAGHAERLQSLAAKQTADDAKALPARVETAKSAGGAEALVETGVDLVGQGQSQQGIGLIQSGIAKGGLSYPADARLHLGIAYYRAGDSENAITSFKSVIASSGDPASGPEAALARLWLAAATHRAELTQPLKG